jgi:hypothetical protein
MTGAVFAADGAGLQRKLQDYSRSADELRARGNIVGAGDEIVEQVAAFASAGATRIMLQWLPLDDIAGLEAMARTLLPYFR